MAFGKFRVVQPSPYLILGQFLTSVSVIRKQTIKQRLRQKEDSRLPRRALSYLGPAAAWPRCLCAVRVCFCLAGLVPVPVF